MTWQIWEDAEAGEHPGFRTKESLVYDFKLEGGVDRYGEGMCVRG